MLKSLTVAFILAIACAGCEGENDSMLRAEAQRLVDLIKEKEPIKCRDQARKTELTVARAEELRLADIFEAEVKKDPLDHEKLGAALDALSQASRRYIDLNTECLIESVGR